MLLPRGRELVAERGDGMMRHEHLLAHVATISSGKQHVLVDDITEDDDNNSHGDGDDNDDRMHKDK
eukprot:10020844-Karenia_brevis.AAC.1